MLDTSSLREDNNNSSDLSSVDNIPSYKILIIGDEGVGKTTLLYRYIHKKFNEINNATIGLDFQEKIVQLSSKNFIKLLIWDTAGSEKFHSIAQSFFTNCDGIVLCFDTSNKTSLDNINGWINYISDYIDITDNKNDMKNSKFLQNENVKEEVEEERENEDGQDNADEDQLKPLIVLVGTKSDLEEKKAVTFENLLNFTTIRQYKYFVTSSKTGEYIDDMFLYMAEELYKKKMGEQYSRGFRLKTIRTLKEGECKSKLKCC